MSEQYPYHHQQQQPQYDQYGQPVPPRPEPQPPFPYEPYQDQQQYTQTWEGQTWDTQYQPTVPPAQQPPEPAPYRPRHAQPWEESAPETAYPPRQAGLGAGVEETAYLPPQGGAYAGMPAGAVRDGVSQYGVPGGAAEDGAPGYGVRSGHADDGVPGYGVPGGSGHEAPSHGTGTTSVPLPPEAPMAPAPAAAPSYEPAAAPAPASGPQAQASAGGAAAGPAYSPPTTVGNARITDAQRARAEGRSPVIAPGMRPAALTAVLGLLLAVAAPVGPYALVVPLIALQAVTAAGWFRLNGMWPARQGIALAFAGGLVADVALLALGREDGPAAILGTLGVWVLLTLVLQLRSHADPDERMYGLMATVASAALAILAGGALAAPPHAVSVGAAAVAVAVLARALPLPAPASVAVALLAAAGAGIAVGGLTGIGAPGALLGLAAGACALIGLRVASYDYPSRFVHMTAGVALPLTAAVPVLYLIGRAVA